MGDEGVETQALGFVAALRQLREARGNPRRQKGVLSVEPRGTRGAADVDPADDQFVRSELSDREVDLLAVGQAVPTRSPSTTTSPMTSDPPK